MQIFHHAAPLLLPLSLAVVHVPSANHGHRGFFDYYIGSGSYRALVEGHATAQEMVFFSRHTRYPIFWHTLVWTMIGTFFTVCLILIPLAYWYIMGAFRKSRRRVGRPPPLKGCLDNSLFSPLPNPKATSSPTPLPLQATDVLPSRRFRLLSLSPNALDSNIVQPLKRASAALAAANRSSCSPLHRPSTVDVLECPPTFDNAGGLHMNGLNWQGSQDPSGIPEDMGNSSNGAKVNGMTIVDLSSECSPWHPSFDELMHDFDA